MAGDWIKMRSDLFEHPKVFKLADLLGVDEFAAVGMLFCFWAWADKHAVDGRVDAATTRLVDKCAHRAGFAEALVSIGWLVVDADGITIPRFNEHNGDSAKERTLKNQRQARWRAGKRGGAVDDEASTSTTTEASTREEKRREEKTTPKAPNGVPDGFDAFWTAYPNKVGKGAAVKAFAKIAPGQDLLRDMLAALADQKCSVRWLKDGGQYVPNPATWLNQQRWLDEGAGVGEAGGGLQLAGAL